MSCLDHEVHHVPKNLCYCSPKIGDTIRCFQCFPIDHNAGSLLIWCTLGMELMKEFSFGDVDFSPKRVAAAEKRSTISCRISCSGRQCRVIFIKELTDTKIFCSCGCLEPDETKERVLVLMYIPALRLADNVCSTAARYRVNKVGASTQSCFALLWMSKALLTSPPIHTFPLT